MSTPVKMCVNSYDETQKYAFYTMIKEIIGCPNYDDRNKEVCEANKYLKHLVRCESDHIHSYNVVSQWNPTDYEIIFDIIEKISVYNYPEESFWTELHLHIEIQYQMKTEALKEGFTSHWFGGNQL